MDSKTVKLCEEQKQMIPIFFHRSCSCLIPLTISCIISRSWDVALTLGQHDVSKTDPFEQNFTIESFYVHEKFDPATQDNDLTIIKLNKPARLSSHVGPICMPPAKHEWQDGSECMTIGWGYDGGGKRKTK